MRRRLSIGLVIAVMLSVCGPLLVAARAAANRDEALLEAVRRHEVDAVLALLKTGVDIHASQADGATVLHWAAHLDDVPMVELLVRNGARVNQTNEYGATPLWLASVNGSVRMVTKLLELGADPNAALHFGETPLLTASRGGALPVVRALLAKGAKVDATEAARKQTALMWAAAEGHVDVMRALVESGAAVETTTTSGFTPLMFVARQGSVEAARLLAEHGAAIDTLSKAGATALLTAVIRGHVDLAEFLLDRGADPNKSGTGYTALHWAAGTFESSTTTDYKFTRHEWRAMRGIPAQDAKGRIITALVAHGADLNARARTEPPRTGYTNIVTTSPSLRQGMTPFYMAAMGADTFAMRLLVALGADPSIGSANNTSPLTIAAGRIRFDAETLIREEDALAAVTLAAELGNNIDAVNNDGETALHAATIAGFNTVIEFLVARGASLSAKTKEGDTPLSIAIVYRSGGQQLERPATAALLRKLGAQ